MVEWVLRSHPNIAGCCIGFIPDYYPQKGRLFEPFAYWKDGEVVKGQAAGPEHDYTKGLFYQFAGDQKAPGWTDPYVGDITKRQIITFAMPIHDEQGRIVAAMQALSSSRAITTMSRAVSSTRSTRQATVRAVLCRIILGAAARVTSKRQKIIRKCSTV